MNKVFRSISVKLLPALLALVAVAVYCLCPFPAVAGDCGSGECVYANQCYSDGACRGGQMCTSGSWQTTSLCSQ
jgi:hypothetical protein